MLNYYDICWTTFMKCTISKILKHPKSEFIKADTKGHYPSLCFWHMIPLGSAFGTSDIWNLFLAHNTFGICFWDISLFGDFVFKYLSFGFHQTHLLNIK